MRIIPHGNRVVVKRDDRKTSTPGGIVLPDRSQDRPQRGTVLAVGFGKIMNNGVRSEIQFNVGDEVVFKAHAGEEFKLDGQEKVLILDADEVVAVLRPE